MGKSKKCGLMSRRKEALKRLEAAYEKFKEAKEDKAPWTTTRRGFKYEHKGRKYNDECKRMANEIAVLKSRIH